MRTTTITTKIITGLRDCTAAKMTIYAALKFPNPHDISAWVLKLFPPVPQWGDPKRQTVVFPPDLSNGSCCSIFQVLPCYRSCYFQVGLPNSPTKCYRSNTSKRLHTLQTFSKSKIHFEHKVLKHLKV